MQGIWKADIFSESFEERCTLRGDNIALRKKAKGICALFKSQKKKRLRLLSGAQNNIFAP